MALPALASSHACMPRPKSIPPPPTDPENHQLAIPFASSTPHSLSTQLHLNKKCSASSTSPELYRAQILSSRFIPTHLLVSTHSFAVLPLSLDRMHLSHFLSTCTHLALPPSSIRFCNTLDFEPQSSTPSLPHAGLGGVTGLLLEPASANLSG